MLRDLHPHTGRAWVIGLTGNPGAGKSTLAGKLIGHWRGLGKRVGVVAVDPSSPFSGGAILGDRIRMQQHFGDSEVFIRSLATRGMLGGLSRSAIGVVRVLDAWGADVILVETVGVGQDELDVVRAAHSTVVVLAPGLGDGIQAIKAGILEIADVYAVNKADKDGVDSVVREIELMIGMGRQVGCTEGTGWVPPIVRCVATRGDGVESLAASLVAHHAWLRSTLHGDQREMDRVREQLCIEVRQALVEAAMVELGQDIERVASEVRRGEQDPYSACSGLIGAFRGRGISCPG